MSSPSRFLGDTGRYREIQGELAVEVLGDLRLAAAEARHVLVLEQHAVVLDRAHLGDARAHQPRAEHAYGAHRGGGLAVGVLLGGGLPEEEAAQRGGLALGIYIILMYIRVTLRRSAEDSPARGAGGSG